MKKITHHTIIFHQTLIQLYCPLTTILVVGSMYISEAAASVALLEQPSYQLYFSKQPTFFVY